MRSSQRGVEAVTGFAELVTSADSLDALEREYLDGVRRFLPFQAAGFYLFDAATGATEHVAASGVSEYFLARYERVGRAADPVFSAVRQSLTPAHAGGVMGADEWRASPVYRDVFQLHRMTVLMEAPILCEGRLIGTLNFADGERGQPTTDELRLAGAFGRVLGAALRGIRERGRFGRERDHGLAALEVSDDAFVLTDLASGERRLNRAAVRLLDELEPADATRCVDELLADRRPASSARVAAQVRLASGDGATLVMETHSSPDCKSIASVLRLRDTASAPALPVVLASALTRREGEAAELVLRGMRNAEIARELMISTHTVKQYLKSAYRKLGVGSRWELSALAHEHAARR